MINPRIASNFLDRTNETDCWVHEDKGEVRSIETMKELLNYCGLKTFCIVTAWN